MTPNSATRSAPPSPDDLLGVLRGVVDPELGSDIVELGMVRDVAIDPGGAATVTVALTSAGCPLRAQLSSDVTTRIGAVPGVSSVSLAWAEMTVEEKARAMDRARLDATRRAGDTAVPATTRVIGIASGKGGVGKSSVTVNLAAALADRGLAVGVLDADIWGFSVPRMLGVEGRLEAQRRSDAAAGGDGRLEIVPARRPLGDGAIEVVSMGLLVDDEQSALMWRGLVLNRAVQHFLEDVRWGDLDYLLIDLPPGTGDVQMGLARMLPRTELIVVTTPSISAQKVAVRAVSMARKSYLRVAGVVENMSTFVCDHGVDYPLFGVGGGDALASEAGIPLLGRIPLEPRVAAGGDDGAPAALGAGPAAEAFRDLATRVVDDAVPLVAMAGCSARMLDAAAAALDALDSVDILEAEPPRAEPPTS